MARETKHAARMTDAQRAEATAALEDRLDIPCPICGTSDWSIVEIIDAVPFRGLGRAGVAETVPILLVGCNNCGFLLHFSALILGLLGPEEVTEVEP